MNKNIFYFFLLLLVNNFVMAHTGNDGPDALFTFLFVVLLCVVLFVLIPIGLIVYLPYQKYKGRILLKYINSSKELNSRFLWKLFFLDCVILFVSFIAFVLLINLKSIFPESMQIGHLILTNTGILFLVIYFTNNFLGNLMYNIFFMKSKDQSLFDYLRAKGTLSKLIDLSFVSFYFPAIFIYISFGFIPYTLGIRF